MYSLNESIKANYINSKPYGSSSGNLKVYIPSLMPLIPMGTPKVTPVALHKSCYSNASDCKPSVDSKINTQNYVTAESAYNQFKSPCYWYGSELVVITKSTDCLKCRLAPEELDNSSNWPY